MVAAAVLGFVRAHQDVLGIDVTQLGAVARDAGDARPVADPHPAGAERDPGPGRPAGGQHQPRQPGGHRDRDLGQRRDRHRVRDPGGGRPGRRLRLRRRPDGRGHDRSASPPWRSSPSPRASTSRAKASRAPWARDTSIGWSGPSCSSARPTTRTGRSWSTPRAARSWPSRTSTTTRTVKGGVYPVTSTEICPSPGQCGIMQPGWPMPFANTGLRRPQQLHQQRRRLQLDGRHRHHHARRPLRADHRHLRADQRDLGRQRHDRHGRHQRPARLHDARLRRRRQHRVLALRLLRGQQDHGDGAAATCPATPGSTLQLTTNVNINDTCNGFWNGSTINFYRSGGGCRNTGELAGVFDHEWGHGLDDNDANGIISNSSEGYADIAAIYRYQDSCVGHGFWWTFATGCGATAGRHGLQRERGPDRPACTARPTARACATPTGPSTSDNTPDTALGYVCSAATTGTGPCGRQVHCAAAPQRQAAWDLVARDLAGAALQPRQPDRVHHRQQALLPGQRQHRRLVRVHLRRDVQRLRRDQRLHAVDHRRRRQRQPERRHAAHDRDPRRLRPPRHRLRDAHPDEQRLRAAARRRPPPSSPPRATTRCRSPGTRSPAPPATGCSAREGHAGCDYGKAMIAEVTGLDLHRHPGGQRPPVLLQRGGGGHVVGLLQPGQHLRDRHARLGARVP